MNPNASRRHQFHAGCKFGCQDPPWEELAASASQNHLTLIFRHVEVGAGPEAVAEIAHQPPLPGCAALGERVDTVIVIGTQKQLRVVVEQRLACPAGMVRCRTVPKRMAENETVTSLALQVDTPGALRPQRWITVERDLAQMAP